MGPREARFVKLLWPLVCVFVCFILYTVPLKCRWHDRASATLISRLLIYLLIWVTMTVIKWRFRSIRSSTVSESMHRLLQFIICIALTVGILKWPALTRDDWEKYDVDYNEWFWTSWRRHAALQLWMTWQPVWTPVALRNTPALCSVILRIVMWL